MLYHSVHESEEHILSRRCIYEVSVIAFRTTESLNSKLQVQSCTKSSAREVWQIATTAVRILLQNRIGKSYHITNVKGKTCGNRFSFYLLEHLRQVDSKFRSSIFFFSHKTYQWMTQNEMSIMSSKIKVIG